MIDFPNNPIEGEEFEDGNGTLWYFSSGQWGNESRKAIDTTFESLRNTGTVNTDEYVQFNPSTGLWSGTPAIKMNDYFMRVGFSSGIILTGSDHYEKFDQVIEEYGTTGSYNTSTYTYTVPCTGIWEVEYHISLDGAGSLSWYRPRLYVNEAQKRLLDGSTAPRDGNEGYCENYCYGCTPHLVHLNFRDECRIFVSSSVAGAKPYMVPEGCYLQYTFIK